MVNNLPMNAEHWKDECIRLLDDSVKDKNRQIRSLEHEVNHNHYHLHQIEQKVDTLLANQEMKH